MPSVTLERNHGLNVAVESHIWLLHHVSLASINRDALTHGMAMGRDFQGVSAVVDPPGISAHKCCLAALTNCNGQRHCFFCRIGVCQINITVLRV
jgi:hypothetical protein